MPPPSPIRSVRPVRLTDVLDQAALDVLQPTLAAHGYTCPPAPCTVASLLRQNTPTSVAVFAEVGREIERLLSQPR